MLRLRLLQPGRRPMSAPPLLRSLRPMQRIPPPSLRDPLYLTRRLLATHNDPPSVPRAPQPPEPKQKSLLSRVLPSSVLDTGAARGASSFRKIVALAKPERKPLGIAIGLLFVSSSVSMSVPFTVGKLIDYFTSTQPVRLVNFYRASRVERVSNGAYIHTPGPMS